MNLYGLDYSVLDLGFADPSLIESLSSSHGMIVDRRYAEREEEGLLKLSNSLLRNSKRPSSPPKHRHDGTSPLPLGMDWSPPPRKWDGPNTIWPHDSHTGWSYCVTIPSLSIFSESEGSEPVAFYRVQVGLQSPGGVAITREVLRRFSDFLKLSSDLKQSFRKKKLPPLPPKGLSRMKSRTLLEERRRSLEDWMAKVLSDIDFSRSAPIAYFLELEAAARSSFSESSHYVPNVRLSINRGSSSDPVSSHSDASVPAGTSALASNYDSDSTHDKSEISSAPFMKVNYSQISKGHTISVDDLVSPSEATVKETLSEIDNATLEEFSEGKDERDLHKFFDGRINLNNIQVGASHNPSHHHDSIENSPGLKNSSMDTHVKGLLREDHSKEMSFAPNEISNLSEVRHKNDTLASSGLQFSHDTLPVLSMDKQQKMNRVLSTTQQKLDTSTTDIEELLARLNQELAVRQYLTTKVKGLETELECSKKSGKENLENAIYIERERFTQMQWDVEEFRRKCMEMEFKLKAQQDAKAHTEETKTSAIKENEALPQELDSAREQLRNMEKRHEEAELKSKSDVKRLVKEVKLLRTSQLELRKELESISKERTEFETKLLSERTKREETDAANAKLLHECEILRRQLEECSVNFLDGQENKLKMDAWSSPDALDILATSENRINLLLGEVQLLAQDHTTRATSSSNESNNVMTTDHQLRKMLTDVLIDNAKFRKQANSVIRSAFNMTASPDSSQIVKGDTP